MGAFNAVVQEGNEDRVVGKFGLGKRNHRGERLIEFCKSQPNVWKATAGNHQTTSPRTKASMNDNE